MRRAPVLSAALKKREASHVKGQSEVRIVVAEEELLEGVLLAEGSALRRAPASHYSVRVWAPRNVVPGWVVAKSDRKMVALNLRPCMAS